MTWEVRCGDSVELMAAMPAGSVDAIVCDPPAGISFMNREWDHHRGGRNKWVEWMAEVLREALRVAKPGAHAFVWSLPRTSHWTGSALELAGWEVRDVCTHLFGSGFPKSHNLPDGFGTALKPAAEFWWLARKPLSGTVAATVLEHGTGALNVDGCRVEHDGRGVWGNHGQNPENHLTEPGSEGTTMGTGWNEPGSTRNDAGRWPANVCLSHMEECVPAGTRKVKGHPGYPDGPGGSSSQLSQKGTPTNRTEAWAGHPDAEVTAYRCHPDCPVRLLDEQTGEASYNQAGIFGASSGGEIYGGGKGIPAGADVFGYGDTGGASRFFKTVSHEHEETECADVTTSPSPSGGTNPDAPAVDGGSTPIGGSGSDDVRFRYVAKASRGERNAGLEGFEERERQDHNMLASAERVHPDGRRHVNKPAPPRANVHPTVKPISLMRWLVRLVTPPGGTVLDPFCGSGSTGCAAVLEGFDFIGLEREAEYVKIAEARIAWWHKHRGDGEASEILAAGEARDEVEATGQLDMFGEAA